MAIPPFHIQLVDSNGVLVKTRTGGSHERDLIEHFALHIMSRGVGLFRTKAQVELAIREGIAEALHNLKVQNPFEVID